jgi:hypothetical protein
MMFTVGPEKKKCNLLARVVSMQILDSKNWVSILERGEGLALPAEFFVFSPQRAA